jgi:hypothetical protein
MAKKPESGDAPDSVVSAPAPSSNDIIMARLDSINASLKAITDILARTNGQPQMASPLPPPRMHHMAGTIRRKGDGF